MSRGWSDAARAAALAARRSRMHSSSLAMSHSGTRNRNPGKISYDQAIGRYHMKRMWPTRHDTSVHVFPSGHVNDQASRRAAVRANIRGQRSAKRYAEANPEKARWQSL